MSLEDRIITRFKRAVDPTRVVSPLPPATTRLRDKPKTTVPPTESKIPKVDSKIKKEIRDKAQNLKENSRIMSEQLIYLLEMLQTTESKYKSFCGPLYHQLRVLDGVEKEIKDLAKQVCEVGKASWWQKYCIRSHFAVITKSKDKNEWCVKSRNGKNLGCYDSLEQAKKRLKQVEFFKHQKG